MKNERYPLYWLLIAVLALLLLTGIVLLAAGLSMPRDLLVLPPPATV